MEQIHLVRRFKNSRLGKCLLRSQGDWRYPFIALGWKLAGLLVPRRKVFVDGVHFTLSCTNWITHFRWYLFRKKEIEVRRYIDNYVKGGDIFFDIGANVGVFSIYCAKKHNNISVYSFEPEYSNLSFLKDNVVCNALLQKIKINGMAVGDNVGLAQLNVQDFTPGAAVHTVNKQFIERTDEGYEVVWSEGVMLVTLDFVCEQLGIVPNTMKIDTDGNEPEVLKGAPKTLLDVRLRSLVLEMPLAQDKKDYCTRILKSAGFSLDWSDSKNTRNEIWIRHS